MLLLVDLLLIFSLSLSLVPPSTLSSHGTRTDRHVSPLSLPLPAQAGMLAASLTWWGCSTSTTPRSTGSRMSSDHSSPTAPLASPACSPPVASGWPLRRTRRLTEYLFMDSMRCCSCARQGIHEPLPSGYPSTTQAQFGHPTNRPPTSLTRASARSLSQLRRPRNWGKGAENATGGIGLGGGGGI